MANLPPRRAASAQSLAAIGDMTLLCSLWWLLVALAVVGV